MLRGSAIASALLLDAAPRLLAGYYDATPFSWDVTSPNISDAPPIGLDWSMGRDGPLPCVLLCPSCDCHEFR